MAVALGLLAVGLAALVCGSEGVKVNKYQEYYIEDLCRRKDTVLYILDEEGIYSTMTLHGSRLRFTFGRQHCNIVIRPPSYHGIILSVDAMIFGNYSYFLRRCLDDYIEVFQGNSSIKLCGHRNGFHIISKEEMRFVYHTTKPGKARFTDLSLVATVYRNEYLFIPCTDNEFRCRRGTCIWDGLACDGVNHCGDFSDEAFGGNSKCQNRTTSTPESQSTPYPTMSGQHVEIHVTVIVCLMFLILLGVYRCLCCTNESSNVTKSPRVVNYPMDESPPPYSYLQDDDDDVLLDVGGYFVTKGKRGEPVSS